ncbi:MAG: 16S rRNA (uracil(1498)-N(3))-methyltransferase [Leptospiraceae bacterium]|nr:16S rRNA (uracil(1498)-N(3))-methyltransferase [Leptospiraceae bacterium]
MLFFRPNETFQNEITLTKEEIEHLRSLRLNEIEKEIEVRDGNGNSYFFQVGQKSKTGKLIEKRNFEIPTTQNKIASAIPKAQRLDFLLQKSTEIGITDFYFINFFQSERRDLNIERCNKIILEACSQSKRHSIPNIKLYNSLEKFILEHQNLLLLNPMANQSLSQNSDWELIPVIGPEGGFRKEEIELLENTKAKSFSIGKNILRIETAHIYMTSIKQFFLS